MSKKVLIGCSKGGLPAVREFFRYSDLKDTYFVVPHIEASQIYAVLKKYGALRIKEGGEIKEGGIYVSVDEGDDYGHGNPFTVRDGKFKITDETEGGIDYFLLNMAEVYGANSVAVILSGSGKDGQLGTNVVDSVGGKVMLQTLPPISTRSFCSEMPYASNSSKEKRYFGSPRGLATLLNGMK